MKRFIYADNAATTQLDIEVFEAMKPYLSFQYGNSSQPYSFGQASKRVVKKAREEIAKCINACPEEIFFTSGGTESDNWAIKGSAFGDLEKRTTIVSMIEHHAVLNTCAAIEKLGYPVAYLRPQRDGTIMPGCLENMISDKTRLVSIMYSNNEIGTIQPIKELAGVAHRHGAIFHTDAVQALGHISIDVNELGVDMLSASAHKFNGPKGVGFLYIRKGVSLEPLLDGGVQEFGKRAGTENVAGIIGMSKALVKSCNLIEARTIKLKKFEEKLVSMLQASGLDFIQNGGKEKIPGNISLSFKDAEGEALLHRLDLMGICVSTGAACDSVNTQISHVLRAIELEESYAKGTIRISLGMGNTEEDIDAIAQALIKILK